MAENKDEQKELILVVEDDPLSMQIVAHLLEDAGYCVQSVADGRRCLEFVQDACPQVILMDINMPVLDGIETCRRLKNDEKTRSIPVIFVTGNTDDQTLASAFGAGGCDYVRKPIGRVELLARVRSVLAQQCAARKLAEDEKLKGVLETAGGVCHELNQPLQFVLGAVQILMMDISPEDALYESLEAIRVKVEKMGDITRKLTAITQYRTRKYSGGQDIIDIQQSIDHSRKNP